MADKKLNKNVNMSYSGSVNAPGASTDLSMSEAHTCTEKCEKMMVKSNGQWSLEKATWEHAPHIESKDCKCGGSGGMHHYSCVDANAKANDEGKLPYPEDKPLSTIDRSKYINTIHQ